jgi:hypothetical protein
MPRGESSHPTRFRAEGCALLVVEMFIDEGGEFGDGGSQLLTRSAIARFRPRGKQLLDAVHRGRGQRRWHAQSATVASPTPYSSLISAAARSPMITQVPSCFPQPLA